MIRGEDGVVPASRPPVPLDSATLRLLVQIVHRVVHDVIDLPRDLADTGLETAGGLLGRALLLQIAISDRTSDGLLHFTDYLAAFAGHFFAIRHGVLLSEGDIARWVPSSQPLDQRRKPRVRAQRVEPRLGAEVDEPAGAGFGGSGEPVEGGVRVAEGGVDGGEVDGGDVAG